MNDPFPQTRWSLVIEAQNDTDSPSAKRALNELCQAYWFPIYSYARRRGLSTHDAEDSTQSFFTMLLSREASLSISEDKGRLRAFLLTAMKHFLNSEWRKTQTQKRGGGETVFSIDLDAAEQRYDREPASKGDSPDHAFELTWARSLLASVYSKLENYYTESKQQTQFEKLRPFLTWGSDDQPYAEIAKELGMSEGSVRTAVHRMRTRYRDLLKAEIRETVTTDAEAADELAYLKRVLTQS